MDLVIIHFKNSSARFLFKTWKMFYHSFSNALKAISRTKFKQGKVCGKEQPHRRVLARRVPRTGLPTVPLSGALWGFYTHSNIPERGQGRGRDVPLWDGEGWLWKGGQKEEPWTWGGEVSNQSISGKSPCVRSKIWKPDSLKTTHTCILHGKSLCLPRAMYIPVSSDLG